MPRRSVGRTAPARPWRRPRGAAAGRRAARLVWPPGATVGHGPPHRHTHTYTRAHTHTQPQHTVRRADATDITAKGRPAPRHRGTVVARQPVREPVREGGAVCRLKCDRRADTARGWGVGEGSRFSRHGVAVLYAGVYRGGVAAVKDQEGSVEGDRGARLAAPALHAVGTLRPRSATPHPSRRAHQNNALIYTPADARSERVKTPPARIHPHPGTAPTGDRPRQPG